MTIKSAMCGTGVWPVRVGEHGRDAHATEKEHGRDAHATEKEHGRDAHATQICAVVLAAVAMLSVAADAGTVLTGAGWQRGDLALQNAAIQVGGANVKWDAVLLMVNSKVPPSAAGEAVHLNNGETWAGKIIEAADGKITIESPLLGKRTLDLATLKAVDFVAGLPLPKPAKEGTLYRVRGAPVPGTLISIKDDKATVDTALGAVPMDKKDISRYMPAAPKEAPAPAAGDELTLADGSILYGPVQATAAGLTLAHPVLGNLTIAPQAWLGFRKRGSSVTWLADLEPASLQTYPLIRRPADPPRTEHLRAGDDASAARSVTRLHIWPRTVMAWKLPATSGGKLQFRAAVAMTEGSRGPARVRLSQGDKMLFDQAVAPGAAEPVIVAFEAQAGVELKLEVDFDVAVRLPCEVTVDDPHVVGS
ncbi:MAG: hypothetical protein ABFD92_19380 [Planctomycetaceae bacterium]|nr:hypothetical protein [Planctomycetaceae bacterium]